MAIAISPKKASRALGVSESSLKRWCDQGLLPAIRTAGGHRKLFVADVLQFARQQGRPLSEPQLLGLPSRRPTGDSGCQALVAALLAGEEAVARQIVFDLLASTHSLSKLFDEVIAAAFHDIGERWSCRETEVYQERRACESMMRLLAEIRQTQAPPLPDIVAIGATLAGDRYSLPLAMAELVLRDRGVQATSLGASIPVESCIAAVEQVAPDLFWLSISHLEDTEAFVRDFASLSSACEKSGVCLVVGGRALTLELRKRLAYSVYCDAMLHLETFIKTFQPAKRQVQRSTPHRLK